jgi:type IV pilus assembly protein PilY1
MKHLSSILLTLLAAGLFFAPSALAYPDQYMGDTSIYEGVAADVGRPNILFIIDNSQSTTRTIADDVTFVATTEYDPGISTQGNDCTGIDNPGKECWLPWNIYKQDNQGDFATLVMENTDDTLATLTCDPSNDNTDPDDNDSDYVKTFFQQYGSYSGSGAAIFPNLDSSGSCVYGITNTSGVVYALGNYLNFLKNAVPVGGEGTEPPPDSDDPCADTPPAPWVRAYEYVERTDGWKDSKSAYFQLLESHTSSASRASTPYSEAGPDIGYWSQGYPNAPAGVSYSTWDASTNYTVPVCDTPPDETEPEPSTGANISQREVIFNTLKDVVLHAGPLVNFGAMVYGSGDSDPGSQNFGAHVAAPMANLSVGVTINDDGDFDVIIDPNCATVSGAKPAYCQFVEAIPGPPVAADADLTDCSNYIGAPCLPGLTARPQAMALFDAGYYFGAGRTGEVDASTYIPITNNMQIAPEDSPCDLNHIILITNGFSNKDGSPNLDMIGDADGDNYENEDSYGLGSHWLDDVARYLQANHKITTHTVLAFQAYDDLVANAAKDGGGQFHLASNEAQLRRALMEIIASIINEKSTSFVAPVVPASTTNRTISSNRVYLGLFKPQGDGPWYGNVKKYGLTADRRLAEPPPSGSGLINGDAANYPDGSFDPDSISFWSLVNGIVPSSAGDIDPTNSDPNEVKGDGGEVDSGGIGGVLLKRVQAWSTDRDNTSLKRNVFTFLPDGSGGWTKEDMHWGNADITATLLGLPDTEPSWWLTGANPAGVEDSSLSLDEIRRRNLIRYTLGFDSLNVQAGESNYDVREWIMGDVLHSRPVVFNYTQYDASHEFTCSETPDADGNYNSSIVFVGANDGMLHAFRDCDGKELWGFIPDNILGNLKYLPEIKHTSYIDSPPSILFYDKNGDGNVDSAEDLVVLVFGQRRGGGMSNLTADSRGSFYALNITDINDPTLMWKLDTSNYAELAETWSLATIKRVKVANTIEDTNNTDIRFVAFVTAGYDNNEDLRHGTTQTFPDGTDDTTSINVASSGGSVDGEDGGGDTLLMTSSGTDADGHNMRGRAVAAILVAQLSQQTVTNPDDETTDLLYVPQAQADNNLIGTVIWSSKDNLPSGSHPYSFASDVTTLDLNNNGGYIDRVYAADTGGNLWRFDTTNRDPDEWTADIMFSANSDADANVGRKFFYQPSVAVQGNETWVCFNSGDREHPLNLSVVDRLYCIKDYYNKYANYEDISGFENHTTADSVNESDLVDVTENILQSSTASEADINALLGKLRSNPTKKVNSSTGAADVSGDFYYGWYIKLDGKDRVPITGDYGEKALAAPVIFQGEVFFSTYQIKTGTRSTCEAGNLGYSRLYRVALGTGEAVFNYNAINDSESTTLNDRALGADGEVLRRSDRVYQLGEGIPSGIVQVVDAAGNVSLLISSSDKVEGIGGSNPTVTFPLYWIQW